VVIDKFPNVKLEKPEFGFDLMAKLSSLAIKW
jgi:hypothetical protein